MPKAKPAPAQRPFRSKRHRQPPGPSEARLRRERLRRRHRPVRLRLLFIGEAPPASGRFFYQGDSGLYRAIRDAFREVEPSLDEADFLPGFRAAGCYLVDACPEPVDRLDRRSREAACRASERQLGRTIRRLQPEAIVTVVRSIAGTVERAVSHAGWKGPISVLPYPGRWQHLRARFQQSLVPMLRALPRRPGGPVR